MLSNLVIFIIIIIILFILSYIYTTLSYNSIYSNTYLETFEGIDKTKLWGSVFLDNLPIQITSLTNPPILYDSKRIELIKYNDVIL
uniref:Uncharacterized protein n=1 Tax=viral metagenome TaxID=1070528 RepID=A0A6C0F0Q2_9ZZZZ